MKLLRFVAVLAGVVLAVACSSESWAERVGESCGRIADLLAERKCHFTPVDRADEVDTCVAFTVASDSGTTAAQLEKCAADLAQVRTCDLASIPSCAPAPGTSALGSGCLADAQCVTRHCQPSGGVSCGKCVWSAAKGERCDSLNVCSGLTVCIEGTCQEVEYVPLGATCGALKRCSDGTCDAKTSVCIPFAAKGESCTTVPCGLSLRCADGVCTDRIGRGGACEPTVGGCDGETFCDPKTSTCTVPQSAGLGEPCDFALSCRYPGVCVAGVCSETLPRRGEACAGDRPQCAEPLVCRDGICKIEDPGRCRF